VSIAEFKKFLKKEFNNFEIPSGTMNVELCEGYGIYKGIYFLVKNIV
jgi:hypothetical protein